MPESCVVLASICFALLPHNYCRNVPPASLYLHLHLYIYSCKGVGRRCLLELLEDLVFAKRL